MSEALASFVMLALFASTAACYRASFRTIGETGADSGVDVVGDPDAVEHAGERPEPVDVRIDFDDAREYAPDAATDALEHRDAVDAIDGENDAEDADAVDMVDASELPPGLVWVSIPAGTFQMGCSPDDDWCSAVEEPRHAVTVPAFLMTETEVTQGQYERVMGCNPSYFAGCPDCPVERTDWYDARAFCEAIGGRLPSEAEWEYAARAGTDTRYPCGHDGGCLDRHAWYEANSGSESHPVGAKSPNAFGLYDMLGNVWEWVEDCWHSSYRGAPSGGEAWEDGGCAFRVLRGGSWLNYEVELRVSARLGLNAAVGYRWVGGLRCAHDPP